MSYLLLTYDYFFFFLDEIHFIWLSFFQKAEKLSSASRIQWRVLSRSLQLYFILFEHEATISTPWFFYQIFFIRLWNVARKIMVSNMGLHIFSAAFYTKKNKKKCRVWCFRGSDLVVLLKIQSDIAKYFIRSCKDEILYNIKTYKLKHILQFAKMRINRAVYKNSWI